MLKKLSIIAGLFCLPIYPAFSGISLDSTRIIYPASAEAKGVQVGVTSSAKSTSPYLIKTQVSNAPYSDKNDAPFVTNPSLFRLDPNNTQPVLLMKKATALPADRESVFYFRAIAIPTGEAKKPGDTSAVSGALEVAGVTIIKVFYRPDNLPMTQTASMGKLQFTAVPQGIQIRNPTPYYVSLSSLKINNTIVKMGQGANDPLISPLGEQIVTQVPKQGSVEWVAINDFGGREVFHGTVR